MRSDDTQTPPSAQPTKAAKAAFKKIGKPKLDRDRFAILALLTSLLSIALAGVIITLLPLKTVVPYIIETDGAGKTVAVGAAQDAFDPTKAQIMHFISRWTKSLWGIDSTLVKKNLEFAYGMTRGKAGNVFRQHVTAYKPIERSTSDPSLSTAVQVKAVNFLGDTTALVRFVTTERRKESKPRIETFMMTLHWVIHPPKTAEQIMQNPIGFFITDFSWSKEVGNDR